MLADDTLAVVDALDGRLMLIVLDAATGETRWSRPWSPRRQRSGMGVGRPAVVNEVVVGLEAVEDGEPTGDPGARVVGSDSRTGEQRWSIEVRRARSPVACGGLVCVSGVFDDDGESGLVALAPHTGEVVWRAPGDLDVVAASSERVITLELGEAPGLASRDARTGQSQWDLRLSEQVDERDLDTSNGWRFREVGDLLVGWVGHTDEALTAAVTVGVDVHVGSVSWRRVDVATCLLPLPEVVLLCRAEGGLSRVDPATGEDLWKVEDLVVPSEGGPLYGFSSSEDRVIGSTGTGRTVAVDVDDGSLRELDGEVLTWTHFGRSVEATLGGGQSTDYTGPIDEPVPWDWVGDRAFPVVDIERAAVPSSVGLHGASVTIVLDNAGRLYGLVA